MPKFSVTYRKSTGETVREVLTGDSRSELLQRLRGNGDVPISIKTLSAPSENGGDQGQQKKKDSDAPGLLSKRVKLGDMAVVFRTLSTMLGGGLSIVDAITDVALQSDNQRLRYVLTRVGVDIREGCSLSEAMQKHPKVFTKLMVAMAHAGEESGDMGGVLRDLSDYLDTQVELRRKIKTGTRYPMFIAGFFVLAITILFVFILPRFEEIFSDLGAELPMITAVVMGLSNMLANNILLIMALLAALGVGTVLFKRTERGARFFDRLVLKIPVVGPMAQKVLVARISRTLGLLIDGGIPVVRALTLTGQVSGNYVFQSNIEAIRDNIVRGALLSSEMKGRPYFPQMLIRMTAAGEATGSIGDMLERVSVHYTREASVSIDSVMSLLEPVLLSLLGVVVGVVVLAVYMPIFQLATAMG